jgi:hypothetical protein
VVVSQVRSIAPKRLPNLIATGGEEEQNAQLPQVSQEHWPQSASIFTSTPALS